MGQAGGFIGYGLTGNRRADAGMPSLTALVDLMMATIGIFVIVFALQEIVSTPPLVPAPYDALAFCRHEGSVAIHRAAEPATEVTVAAFKDSLATLLPQGGRLMLGVSEACARASENGGSSPIQTLIGALEEASALQPDRIDPLHRFELVPIGAGAHGEADLVKRWHATAEGRR